MLTAACCQWGSRLHAQSTSRSSAARAVLVRVVPHPALVWAGPLTPSFPSPPLTQLQAAAEACCAWAPLCTESPARTGPARASTASITGMQQAAEPAPGCSPKPLMVCTARHADYCLGSKPLFWLNSTMQGNFMPVPIGCPWHPGPKWGWRPLVPSCICRRTHCCQWLRPQCHGD